MKFFRKTSVAVLLTALVAVLCCVWGYTRAYTSVQQQEETQSQRAGENNLNYFLRQFQDDARLFDLDTTDTLARSDLELNNTYGTMLALRTANYLNGQDIESYAKDYFAAQKLGRTDMLLVIEVNSRAWYLVYGPGLRSYADGNQALATLVRENLDDVAGIRIICSFLDDIYEVAEMLVRQDDVKVIAVKDYIKNPKPNGYRSYHLIIEVPVFFTECKRNMRVEVQIRTIAMDFWASLDHQLKYKKDLRDDSEISQELKQCADVIAQTDAKMLAIRQKIEAQGIAVRKE